MQEKRSGVKVLYSERQIQIRMQESNITDLTIGKRR